MMLRIWWAARERQRFYTYSGSRQHPKRPRVLVGSWARRMMLRPDVRARTKVLQER